MDTAALLAAIDDELEELGDETASQSSWQTMPAAGSERPSAKKTRLKGKRLTRSKKAQIEVALMGVKAEIDVHGADDATSGRVHITAKSLEILDHIKTSTWKKFLSEMRADARGNIRETGADMLRVELMSVRPSLPHPDEELRLKVRGLISSSLTTGQSTTPSAPHRPGCSRLSETLLQLRNPCQLGSARAANDRSHRSRGKGKRALLP